MPQPQPGIVPEPRQHARFLILRVREPQESAPAVARVLAGMPRLTATVGALDRRAKLVCAVGIGPDFWNSLSPQERPKGLRPFTATDNKGKKAPHTGGDLLFHIISKRRGLEQRPSTR
jgi:porphyrinogen peroxidase